MTAIVAAVLAMAGAVMAGGGPLPTTQLTATNGTYSITNTGSEPMYLDALDLKSMEPGTWTVTLYNGNAITNTLLSVAAAQVEWRTNMVNSVRLNKSGVMAITTTYVGVGSNSWVNAYWSAR